MTLAIAFLGGLVSCLSPCVLPILPVFTAYVGGARTNVESGQRLPRSRAAGFLLGFAGVFVALWVSIGLLGFALLAVVPTIRPLAGLAILALGLVRCWGGSRVSGLGPLMPVGRSVARSSWEPEWLSAGRPASARPWALS